MKWELEQIRELWNFVKFHMQSKQCGRCCCLWSTHSLSLSIVYFKPYCFTRFHCEFSIIRSLISFLLFLHPRGMHSHNWHTGLAFVRNGAYNTHTYIRSSRISATSMIVQLLLNHKTFRYGRTRSIIKFHTNAKAERMYFNIEERRNSCSLWRDSGLFSMYNIFFLFTKVARQKRSQAFGKFQWMLITSKATKEDIARIWINACCTITMPKKLRNGYKRISHDITNKTKHRTWWHSNRIGSKSRNLRMACTNS